MSRRNTRGFSLIELMVVVAIILVIAVIAVPQLVNTVANARLRAAATSLAGIIQDARSIAVKTNRVQTVRFVSVNKGPFAYVKDATASTTTLANSDPQVQLGAPIIQVTTPTGGVPALDSTTLGFTPLTLPNLPSFNPRGLPCLYPSSPGVCVNNGFVYYFTDQRQSVAWTAVSITPAGRVKTWFWYGDKWGN